MADGAKQRKSPVSGTDWTLITVAAAAGIVLTLTAILAHLL
ncbi:hypothetical protein [Roseibium sp. Sym1]|nr:hypothetical protein [Roseibium sp. Sym1]